MTPEKRLMAEIRLWCGKHNWLCLRANVGKVKMADGRWFDTGLPVGYPDLTILTDDGRSIFIETKIKPRKPTKEQIEFIAELTKRGFKAFVCYDLNQFLEEIKK